MTGAARIGGAIRLPMLPRKRGVAPRRADGGTAAAVAQEQIEVFGIGVKK